jgi:hypothetical protein
MTAVDARRFDGFFLPAAAGCLEVSLRHPAHST